MSDFRCSYHINEFAIDSEIDMLCDASQRSSCVIPDADTLIIRRASLANVPSLLRKIRRQIIYDVGDGFLIEPTDNLALHIDLKTQVFTIDSADDQLPVAAAWAKHAALGAATLIRGGVPLHGAGLEINGQFVCLTAGSGTGKSTFSWFLMQNGALFGNDDLIPVRFTNAGAIAYPSVSLYPKLRREAIDRHGIEKSRLLPADYGTGEEEFYVILPPEMRATGPRPLAAIIHLTPYAPDEHIHANDVEVHRLSQDKAFHLLINSLHTVWLLKKWMDINALENLCRRLGNTIPVYEIRYTRNFDSLPALADAIKNLL